MDVAVALALVVASVVHLVPLTGVRSARVVSRLYGVAEPDDGTALLLRHRAVLLALVGTVLLAGALDRDVRALALAVGIVSTASYVVLGRGTRTPQLRRVLLIDVAVLVALLLAAAAHLLA